MFGLKILVEEILNRQNLSKNVMKEKSNYITWKKFDEKGSQAIWLKMSWNKMSKYIRWKYIMKIKF